MRTSLMVLASFLLLLASRAHGIRLDRQLHEAINNKQELGHSKAGQPSNAAADDSISRRYCTPEGHCSGTTMEQRIPATAVVVKDRDRVVSAFARPVPRFHEDYYGPGKPQKPLAAHAEPAAAKHQKSPKRNGEAEAASHGEAARGAAGHFLPPQTTYPDILDIAGMDYSPATRKPPIHN